MRATTTIRTWFAALVALLLATGVLLAGGAPAAAIPGDEPVATPVRASTDLVIRALGPGQSVDGYTGPASFDPVASGYPASNPTTPPWVRSDQGFAGVILARSPGSFTDQQLYCIDLFTSTGVGVGYTNGTWGEADVPNVGYVARLLNTYYPTNPDQPSVLPTAQQRAAAVQSAIWFFTDRYVLRTQDPLHDAVAAIVTATIAAGPVEQPDPPEVTITPPQRTGSGDDPIGPYTVTNGSGQPLVVTALDATMYADAGGTTPIANGTSVPSGTQIWLGGLTPGATGTLQATATVPVPSGNVYLYDGNVPGKDAAQKLILASTGNVSTSVTATATRADTGGLQVTKIIAGPGAGLQGPVEVSVDCGDGVERILTLPAGQAAGDSVEFFDDIPTGSTCTTTEPADGANAAVTVTTTIEPSEVTIVEGQTAEVTVTDTYTPAPGSLRVTKTIAGDGAGLQGFVRIDIECGAALSENLTVEAGTPAGDVAQTYTGIPPGTVCTVTELEAGDNDAVSVVTTGSPTQVTIAAGQQSSATITNTYTRQPGSLVVTKVIAGPGAGLQGAVEFQLDCLPGITEGLEPGVAAGSYLVPFEDLPAGAECTLSETATGTNAQVSVVTTGVPFTFTVPAGGEVTRTVTDTYTPNPGSLEVSKLIAGPGAGLQGEVVVSVDCGDDVERVFTLPAGTPNSDTAQLFDDIPAGTECTVTETADGANAAVSVVTTGSPTTVTIEPGQQADVGITNTYSLNPGSLEVSKLILGPGAGLQGEVVIDVDCGDGVERVFTLPAGTPNSGTAQLFDDIPAGTECTVTETADGANTAVSVVVDGSPTAVTIEPGQQTDVEISNTYSLNPGSLQVTKTIAGAGAGLQDDSVIEIDCGPVLQTRIDTAAGSTGVFVDDFPGLPAGTECTVTETADGANTAVSVVVTLDPDPATVTIAPGQQSDVGITNTYSLNPGSLEVSKTILGPGAGLQGEVVIDVDCGDGVERVFTLPAGTPNSGTARLFDDIPAGTECTVTETADGANTAVSVVVDGSPTTVTIEPGQQTDVGITNTYSLNPGSLELSKVIAGPGAGLQGEVVISVDCGDDVERVLTIPAGTGPIAEAQLFDDIPAGSECTITETSDGANDAVSVVVTTDPDPATVTIEPGQLSFAGITNTYSLNPGSLELGKVIAGPGAGLQGEVVISVDCGDDVERVLTIPAGTGPIAEAQLFDDIPAGSECTITETSDGANDAVSVVVTTDPDPATVTIEPGQLSFAGITNTYSLNPGSLELSKVIAGAGAGLQGEVVISADCGDDVERVLTIPSGTPASDTAELFDAIPAGTECTITETSDGANTAVSVVVAIDPATVTIAPGQQSDVGITNTYSLNTGSLEVEKTIAGAGAGSQGEVVIRVDCGDGVARELVIPAGTTDSATAQLWEDIPAGSACKVTETADGANDVVDVVTVGDGAVVPIVAGEQAYTAVTNTYTLRSGSLEVVKTFSGDGAGHQGQVVLHVECDDGLDTTYAIEAGATGTRTATYDDLPAGTACRVSEASSGANDRVTVHTSSSANVIIVAGGTTVAEVHNEVTFKHHLPHTGAEGVGALAALGSSAVGAGGLLLLLARRRLG